MQSAPVQPANDVRQPAPVASPKAELDNPLPQHNGTLQRMKTHWVQNLDAEKAGITPEALEEAKASTLNLAQPIGKAEDLSIAAFEYVKLEADGMRIPVFERIEKLLEAAAAQSLPTLALPISWIAARDIANGKQDDTKFEFLLPVPAGTRVDRPLVSGRRSATRIRCGGAVPYEASLQPLMAELDKQISDAGGKPTGFYVRLARVDDWFEALKNAGGMTYQVCIAFN